MLMHFIVSTAKKCLYPLTSEAYDRIKEEEDKKLLAMEDRVAKMEHTLQSVSDGNTTFQLRREDGSIEEVTLKYRKILWRKPKHGLLPYATYS